MGKQTEKTESNLGYWMYADGYSCWGMGLLKNSETPIRIPEAIHKGKQLSEEDAKARAALTPEARKEIELKEELTYRENKLNFYKETMEKAETDKKAKAEAEKEAEKAKPKAK